MSLRRSSAQSARKHLADVDAMLSAGGKTPTADEFKRATVHANSVIDELQGQARFQKLRFPGAGALAQENDVWAKEVMDELAKRKAAIEKVDDEFFGTLPGPPKRRAMHTNSSGRKSSARSVVSPIKKRSSAV